MKADREKIPGGNIWLLADGKTADTVKHFVCSGNVLTAIQSNTPVHTTPRSSVWILDIEGLGKCVIKEFNVSKKPGFGHRLESAFKLRFVHRGLRTMRIAKHLKEAGVRTFTPLAFWTDFRCKIRNYIIYKYLEGEVIGDRWMGELEPISPTVPELAPLSQEALISFLSNAGAVVRDLHDAGVIHTDLHPKNFISPDAVHGAAPLYIIDLDSAHIVKSQCRRMRFTMEMRSLRRLAQCFKSEDDPGLQAFVRAYSRNDPEMEAAVLRALRFWRGRKWRSTCDSLLALFRCPPPRAFVARGRESYDLVFSIGWDCKCSQSLRSAGLQHFSYPCDWLIGASPQERARIVSAGFENWFNLDDLEDCGPARFNRFAAVTRIAFNRANGIEFRHDFPLEMSIADGYPQAAAKYERRIKRLITAIETAKNPLAVFCDGYGCQPISLEALQEARAILSRRFGEKITLLGIFDDQPGQRHEAQESFSADGKTIRWSLPCEKRVPDGIVVRNPVVAKHLRARISCLDPHSPAERRERRLAERRAKYGKYKASTWLGMSCNKLLFRFYRFLGRILQKKGIIPSNNPMAQRSHP